MQFTVGLKLKGKTDHIAVDAEDALVSCSPRVPPLCKNRRASPMTMHTQRTGKRPSAVARATILPLL